jgi:toxin ParE1/3/4
VKYRLRAAAARDLDDAAEWYRTNALDHRVALRFLLEVRAALETIADAPLAFPEVHGNVRRCPVHAFPAYSIFYRVVEGVVIVTAVFHGRRRPSLRKSRR